MLLDTLPLAAMLRAFGRPVIWAPKAGGPPVQIRAVFDAAAETVDIDRGGAAAGVVTRKPTLILRLADLPSPPLQGDRIEVDGQGFRVAEVRPDGDGGATLPLIRLADRQGPLGSTLGEAPPTAPA